MKRLGVILVPTSAWIYLGNGDAKNPFWRELNGAEEAISVKEAIRGYTIDGAYSGFEEKKKGSTEPGKLADLIVLSSDPLTVPPDQIKNIQVLMTILDGRIDWRKNI